MNRSVLIVMLDVLVLSVLSQLAGSGGNAAFVLPVHRWSEMIQRGMQREQEYRQTIDELRDRTEQALRQARELTARIDSAANRESDALTMIDQLRNENESLASELEAAVRTSESLAARTRDAEDSATRARIEAELARKAESESRNRAEAAEVAARLAAEQEKQAAARADAVARDIAAARKAADTAEQAARESAIRTRLADEERKAAEKAGKEAARQLATAEARARAATEQQTRAAQAEAASTAALKTMLEEKNRALQDARAALDRTQAAEMRAAVAEQRLADLARREAELVQREQLALRSEAAASEQVRGATNRLAVTEQALAALHEKVVDLEVRRQEAVTRAEVREQTVQETVAALRADTGIARPSVWVEREKAMRRFRFEVERAVGDNETVRRQHELLLPAVRCGDRTFLLSGYESLGLGLDWWEVKMDQSVLRVIARGALPTADAPESALETPLLFPREEPRVCLVQVPPALAGDALTPIGMAGLKGRPVQRAILFSRSRGDLQQDVALTPPLEGNLVLVRPVDGKAPFAIEPGDYLLTDRGEYVGVLVAPDRAFVLPVNPMEPDDALAVPVTRPSGQKYYDEFARGIREARKRIKSAAP